MTDHEHPMTADTGTEGRDPRGRYTRQPETVERDAKALALRARGKTYAAIATELGYCDKAAAHKAVQRGLTAPLTEPADDLRTLELERLDRLTAKAWEVLEREHVTVSHGHVVMHESRPLLDDGPVLAAVDRLLRIAERRAKLLGLDAPVKAEIGGQLRYEVVAVDLDKV